MLYREGDGTFLISQHKAAIQGLGKAHESHYELPWPVTAGKHAHICSGTRRTPPAQK